MQITGRRCVRQIVESYKFSVYFMKGNDPRPLHLAQQNQVSSIIEAATTKSSILLYNPNETVKKIENWKRLLPWIKPHYAVKSNPCEEILGDLIQRGSGLDCASMPQIKSALKAGGQIHDVVYSNSVKNEEDLIWAEKVGVTTTTADSIDELNKIKEHAPKMRILWRISIQEEAQDDLATPFSGKFGDDLDSIESIHSRMLQISSMGINLKGIHFHCGSGHHGSSGFGKAVQFARTCMEIGRKYGHDMDLLDIGGGFPSGDLSHNTIEALKPTKNDPLGYQVIAEPGRHFSGNSFYLATRVLGRRVKNGKPCYHLNESLYHSFNCNLMDSVSFENQTGQFYSKVDDNNEPVGIYETKNSTLFGMTCDGLDIIAKNLAVPADLKVGDWLLIGGMGAYTYGCRSNFNGMTSTDRIITWPVTLGEESRRSLSLA